MGRMPVASEMPNPPSPRRSYRSKVRRGEASTAIIEAAGRLFSSRGFAATSIEEIAREAGVARPTVFAAVGTKAAIFQEVLEAALVGDGPAAPVEAQPWFLEVLAQRDQRRLLRVFVHAVRGIGERISDLYWAAEVASEHDDEVRELWRTIDDERLAAGRPIARTLRDLGPLRGGVGGDAEVAVAITTMASPAIWRALVRDAGWSPQQFEDWVTDALCRMLLP